MTKLMLISPGAKTPRVRLLDVLRESHDAFRAGRVAEIEKRKKIGTPLDDTTKWGAVDDMMASLAASRVALNSVEVARIAGEILTATAGNAIIDPGEFKPDDFGIDLSGVEIVMQIVDEATALDWSAERVATWKAVRDATDIMSRRAASRAMDSLYERIVARVIVEVHGVDGLEPTHLAENIAALSSTGLTGPLYSAAQAMLDLPAPKKLRCGQPAQ